LFRGIAAVVADALPGIGRAPASAGPRRLAPLPARPAALGISVGEQQSHYCDTEQNKTDRAHAVLPVHLIPSPNSLRTRPSQPRASRHSRASACGPHGSRKRDWLRSSRFLPMPVMSSHASRMVRSVPPSLVGSGRCRTQHARIDSDGQRGCQSNLGLPARPKGETQNVRGPMSWMPPPSAGSRPPALSNKARQAACDGAHALTFSARAPCQDCRIT
jgi:hypothetical protein